jgi:glycosyltransferase involved in cell wall biosynthesis
MPSQIDDEFVFTFNQNPKIIKPILLKIFFQYLYVTICSFSDLCIVHTKTAKRVLMEYFPKGDKKINIIPTTIPSIVKTNLKKKKYFLYFGYIARRKGLESLIDGFKKYCQKNPKSKFQLLLAGGVISGQEDSLKELKKSISTSRVKNRIKYLGFLEKDKQSKLYEEAYGVVIPAKLSISTSGPLYHAFSHGKFVIATNIGHLKDEIKSEHNGYLISNNHWYQAFTKSINNPKWVARVERGAAETAMARSPLKSSKIYKMTYKTLISKNV